MYRRLLRVRQRKNGITLHPLGLAIFVACIVILIGFCYEANHTVWAIEVDGSRVALVPDEETVTKVLDQLEEQYGNIERQRLRLIRVPYEKEFVLTPEVALADKLAIALGCETRAVGVKVNGDIKFVLPDRATARTFLEEVKKAYCVEDGAAAKFLDDVALVDLKVPRGEVSSLDQALTVALNREGSFEYKIKNGDTLWDIAARYDISIDEILSANPGLDENDILGVGEVLTISKKPPVFTVATSATVTVEEAIPYRVKIRRDSSLRFGVRKVLEPGEPGRREVTYRVERLNGKVVEREEIASNVIKSPKDQVEVRGSRLIVASRSGDGQLIWPVRGHITSGFGMRWGKMHPAIDIATAYGTPVAAAAAGTVVEAGWGGGYGWYVEIDHGSGVHTRYCHLSAVGVKVGHTVERGEYIGRVGTSGNSTGPHLHFEVRKNGTPLNPLIFLP